LLVASS